MESGKVVPVGTRDEFSCWRPCAQHVCLPLHARRFHVRCRGVALGCPVFPAGGGQTELQARAVASFAPRYYTGTPSFLKIILEKADKLGLDSSSFDCGLRGEVELVACDSLPNDGRVIDDRR